MFAEHSGYRMPNIKNARWEKLICVREFTGPGFSTQILGANDPLLVDTNVDRVLWTDLFIEIDGHIPADLFVGMTDRRVSSVEGTAYGHEWPPEINDICYQVSKD
jgi:hypothetical protein